MNKYILILVAALALTFSGCSTPTTTSTITSTGVVVTSKDPVVIAEITTQIAYDTFDTLHTLEFQNRVLLLSKAPAVDVAIRSLLSKAPVWLATARTLTKVYEANSTPANLYNLQSALAVINQGLVEAQSYSLQMQTLK